MTDDQIPFDHPDLVANPEPRCAWLLLLDTSGSMHGQPIAELNAGLVTLKDELMADAMAVRIWALKIAMHTHGAKRYHSNLHALLQSRHPLVCRRLFRDAEGSMFLGDGLPVGLYCTEGGGALVKK